MKTIPAGSGVRVESGGESLISSAGAAMLLATARVSGLARVFRRGWSAWRAARTVHDPGKTVLDLAVAIALGGDCLADIAVVRAQPELFGLVASDPTVSRLIDALAERPVEAIAAIGCARAGRGRGVVAPPHRSPRRPSPDRGRSGRHPDRGPFGKGARDAELQARVRIPPDARVRRPRHWRHRGAAGRVAAARERPTPTTPPTRSRSSTPRSPNYPSTVRSRVLVRGDAGSGVHAFLAHPQPGMEYSVGCQRPPTRHRRPDGAARGGVEEGPRRRRQPVRAPRSPS